jgi:hypothetical protein
MKQTGCRLWSRDSLVAPAVLPLVAAAVAVADAAVVAPSRCASDSSH